MVLKKVCALMFSMPEGPFPRRFWGLRLKSTRRSDCASEERNCGIPSLALGEEEGRGGERGGGEEEGGEERSRSRTAPGDITCTFVVKWTGVRNHSLEYHCHGCLAILSLERK